MTDLEVTKRPKLDPQFCTASNGASSEGEPPSGRPDVRSAVSTPNPDLWHATDGPSSPLSSALPRPFHSAAENRQPYPIVPSPTFLPGYRDSMFANAQQPPYWKDSCRDEARPQLPGISSIGERRPSTSWSASDSLIASGTFQHPQRTTSTFSPPILSTETTNQSTVSSTSTSSPAVYTPSTPVDADRTLPPFPAAFSNKPTEERHLSPLRTPSVSSQSSITVTTIQSPNGTQRVPLFSLCAWNDY